MGVVDTVGIIGLAACGYAAYRYYASISARSPARFLLSENIQVMPDGTFVIANAGIKTGAIENRDTGERITVTPTDADGSFRLSYTNAQHAFDGIETRALRDKMARWTNGSTPGIVIMPFREILDILQTRAPKPVSPTLFIAYILPTQDSTLAKEINDRTARCTILFSRSPAAGLTMQPSAFDAGTQSDHVWGWTAIHEYSRHQGRYDIKARVTRADGRVSTTRAPSLLMNTVPVPGRDRNRGSSRCGSTPTSGRYRSMQGHRILIAATWANRCVLMSGATSSFLNGRPPSITCRNAPGSSGKRQDGPRRSRCGSTPMGRLYSRFRRTRSPVRAKRRFISQLNSDQMQPRPRSFRWRLSQRAFTDSLPSVFLRPSEGGGRADPEVPEPRSLIALHL